MNHAGSAMVSLHSCIRIPLTTDRALAVSPLARKRRAESCAAARCQCLALSRQHLECNRHAENCRVSDTVTHTKSDRENVWNMLLSWQHYLFGSRSYPPPPGGMREWVK
jgi:hypothetical protein